MDSIQPTSDEQIIYHWNNSPTPEIAAQKLGMERIKLHWVIQQLRKNGVEVKRHRRRKRNYARLKEVNDATQRNDSENELQED